jgi:hypothetical protein
VFLGPSFEALNIVRMSDMNKGIVSVFQKFYIKKILKKFGLWVRKFIQSPFEFGNVVKTDRLSKESLRGLIGLLHYLEVVKLGGVIDFKLI